MTTRERRHPNFVFYSKMKVKGFHDIIKSLTKNTLTKPVGNKSHMADSVIFLMGKKPRQKIFLADERMHNASLTRVSSTHISITDGSTSPRTGSIQWFFTSSKVMVSSPQERKKVCVEGPPPQGLPYRLNIPIHDATP